MPKESGRVKELEEFVQTLAPEVADVSKRLKNLESEALMLEAKLNDQEVCLRRINFCIIGLPEGHL